MAVPKAVKRQVALGTAYQNTFARGDGRRVLIDLMTKARILDISGDDGPFENGRRSMVAEILAITRYDYAKLLALAEERVEDIGGEE